MRRHHAINIRLQNGVEFVILDRAARQRSFCVCRGGIADPQRKMKLALRVFNAYVELTFRRAPVAFDLFISNRGKAKNDRIDADRTADVGGQASFSLIDLDSVY